MSLPDPVPPWFAGRGRAITALLAAVALAGLTAAGGLALDADGVGVRAELAAGTDPTVVDTDGDGLDDGREVGGPTDPTAADTDGDGLDDGREVDGPTDPTAADTDGDGLDDGREVELGADPTRRDTDGDGLGDAREERVGTSPRRPDTDRDGFVDGVEVRAGSVLPGSDPTRYDVYLEVDVAPGCSVDEQVARTVAAFADAPVENPDGTTGVTLHVERGGHDVRGPVFLAERPDGRSLGSVRAEYFDNDGYGYHYAVVANATRTGYAGVHRNATTIVTCGSGDTFAHELGHSLGLDGAAYEGIDNATVDFAAYPSVMNYNARGRVYRYSNGTAGPRDFDDWAYVVREGRTPDRTELRLVVGIRPDGWGDDDG